MEYFTFKEKLDGDKKNPDASASGFKILAITAINEPP